jgi:hypothetical protein
MPESAARTEPAPAYAAGGAIGTMAMVIDYHALANAAMPAAMPIAKATPITPVAPMIPAAPAKVQMVSDSVGQEAGLSDLTAQQLSELEKAKEALAKKDTEISMLRRESAWMKRTLRDRDEELKALKSTKVSAKPAPKKKLAEATQIR